MGKLNIPCEPNSFSGITGYAEYGSKEPTNSFKDFIHGEVRYSQLMNVFPDIAGEMFELAEKHAKERYETYKRLAQQQYS